MAGQVAAGACHQAGNRGASRHPAASTSAPWREPAPGSRAERTQEGNPPSMVKAPSRRHAEPDDP
jgi:hypothetical protein